MNIELIIEENIASGKKMKEQHPSIHEISFETTVTQTI
jgi:hypothetical protein